MLTSSIKKIVNEEERGERHNRIGRDCVIDDVMILYSSCGVAQHERTTFWKSTLAKSFSSHTDANPLRSDSMSKLFCVEKSDFFFLMESAVRTFYSESPEALMKRELLHLSRSIPGLEIIFLFASLHEMLTTRRKEQSNSNPRFLLWPLFLVYL